MARGLFTALKLTQPASMAPPAKKASATVAPSSDAAKAEYDRELNEAARFAATLGDDEAKRELALALKAADKARTDAVKLGDASGREAALKKATEAIKVARTKALERIKAKLKPAPADGAKPDDKAAKPEEKKDGKPKLTGSVITDKGKLGLGGAVESEAERKTAKGTVVNCSASFEGKAYVESKPVPYAETPGEMELTFHLVLGGKASAGAKRDREAGADGKAGGVKASVSVEYELSYKRRASADEARRYIDAMKSGRSGGFEELKALELAVKGSMTEARAIVERLGGKQREMKEDDETEESLSASAEGGVDVSTKKGAFGIALSLGASASGSLTRKIAFKDGRYWVTLTSASGKGVQGGGGFSVEGVGMNVSGNKETRESRAVTFVIDPKKPELKPLLEQVMAAKSIAQMLDLQARNPGVASFDAKTAGGSEGGGVGVSIAGVGITGANQTFGSNTEIVGPDGKTTVHTGGNSTSASATVGDKTVGGSKHTDKFAGGKGADGKGFGETSATDTTGDLFGGIGDVYDKLKKSPLTTAKNLIDGKEEISKEKTRVEGAAFTDGSYVALAARANGSPAAWGKYWRGDIACYTDWVKTQAKVRNCSDDVDKIATVIAAFERVSGRGRHDTVRNAIAGTAVVFEFPASLVSKKPFYDLLVVNDPLPAALGAGAPAEVLKKLEELLRQLNGFRDDMSKSQAEFMHPNDYQDMVSALEQRGTAILGQQKSIKAKMKAADDQARGVGQFTPPEPNQSKVDLAKERERVEELVRRINELKRGVDEAHADEQRTFTRWETDLKGTTVLGVSLSKPDLMKIIGHEKRLRGLYPKWDAKRKELRELLADAGKGFDATEADALQPDRPRYRTLRAKGPKAEFNEADGV